MKAFKTFLVVLCMALVTGPVAADSHKDKHSGWLGDTSAYGKLTEVEGADEAKATGKVKRWMSKELESGKYHSAIIDPVVLYPEPDTSKQVSAATLKDISEYLTTRMRGKVASITQTTSKPGPGVVKVQGALTAVEVKTEGMKGYEVLPIAAVWGAAKAAGGTRDRDVKVLMEVKLVDSQSGQLVGAITRELVPADLKGKDDQLKLEDVRPGLDSMSNDASDGLSEMLGG